MGGDFIGKFKTIDSKRVLVGGGGLCWWELKASSRKIEGFEWEGVGQW